MSEHRVLLVEDESALRFSLRRFLERLDYEVEEAGTCRAGERAIRNETLDAAILDYYLPDGTALDLLPQLQAHDPRVPTVVLTGEASIELAVRSIQHGADHFLTKPLELSTLAPIVARLVEVGRMERQLAVEQSRSHSTVVDPFVGRSEAVSRLAEEARRIVASDATILIQGETGTGKGVLARWIHSAGTRSAEPLVEINCAALSRELLESELFGHRKGAFTGAVSDKAGLLEVANHGTVFLDEIGDFDSEVQPRLLKTLEDRRVRRVGDTQERSVDVRFLVASNRDLAAAASDGSFRSDLYYRVSTVTLRVPPLRERVEDIPELAEALISKSAAEMGRLSVRLGPSGIDRLCSYSWPGNVREMKNVLERAVLLSRSDELAADDLRFDESHDPRLDSPPDLSLEEVERRHIDTVLRLSDGRVAEAARRLKVPRSTLYDLIKRHGISLSESRTTS